MRRAWWIVRGLVRWAWYRATNLLPRVRERREAEVREARRQVARRRRALREVAKRGFTTLRTRCGFCDSDLTVMALPTKVYHSARRQFDARVLDARRRHYLGCPDTPATVRVSAQRRLEDREGS